MAELKASPRRHDKGCPICGKSENLNSFPFCSKACADLDLGKWLMGDYRIPVVDEEDSDGEAHEKGY